MSALAPVAPIEPQILQPAQPVQIDAFAAQPPGAGLDPSAIGQTLISGLDGFNAHESDFRAQVQQAIDPANSQADMSPGMGSDDSARPLTASEAIDRGNALQRKSMGVMMQTYSFALEATLVTNAATTFTSSINTLIKTQ